MWLAGADNNQFVERDVGIGQCLGVAHLPRHAHHSDVPLELLYIGVGKARSGLAEGKTLQGQTDRNEDLLNLRLSNSQDLRRLIGPRYHKALVLQVTQRFPHRSSADAQPLCKFGLDQPLSGLQPTGDDRGSDHVRHLMATRRRLQPVDFLTHTIPSRFIVDNATVAIVKADASREPASSPSGSANGGLVTEGAVATYGEALAAFHPQTIGPLASVRNYAKYIGGAEVNVAIGLARLGHRSVWLGATGADAIGHEVLATLRAERVDVSKSLVDPDGWTGLYLKELGALGELHVHYFRAGSAATTVEPADLNLAALDGVELLHLSGITAAISDQSRDVLTFMYDVAAKRGIPISFDANVRKALVGNRDARALLEPFISRCDVLFLSAAESDLFFGTSDPAELESLRREIKAQEVVVHDESGAFCLSTSGLAEVQAREVTVVDVVGGGDAMVAGYLSGRLRGWEPLQRLRLAEYCAAAVVSVPGDHTGLPSEAQALAWLDLGPSETR
jgi:2-dehydro-3-deoxygluconokinase